MSASADGSAGHPEPEAFVFTWDELPTATAALPGTGGVIRTRPEDFIVTELPSYLPQGKGSHHYLWIRKTGLTTRDLVRSLQNAGVPANRIGVAGLKDKHAVTTQWLSVPNQHAGAIDALAAEPGVEVLEHSRHKNKLGMGHLRGNRFEIRIRDAGPDAVGRARAIVARLGEIGAPNFFGPQRFGRYGRNAVDGLELLRGGWVPGDHRLKRFFLSALQSLLYNRLLTSRMERDWYRKVLVGDWAKKHDTGGEFLVEDAAESERAERLEISALLPLWGSRIGISDGEPGRLEQAILDTHGLAWKAFRARRGARRISRVALADPEVREDADGLIVAFSLPKGAYATTVLREIMKVDVDEPDDMQDRADGDDASAGDSESADQRADNRAGDGAAR